LYRVVSGHSLVSGASRQVPAGRRQRVQHRPRVVASPCRPSRAVRRLISVAPADLPGRPGVPASSTREPVTTLNLELRAGSVRRHPGSPRKVLIPTVGVSPAGTRHPTDTARPETLHAVKCHVVRVITWSAVTEAWRARRPDVLLASHSAMLRTPANLVRKHFSCVSYRPR